MDFYFKSKRTKYYIQLLHASHSVEQNTLSFQIQDAQNTCNYDIKSMKEN